MATTEQQTKSEDSWRFITIADLHTMHDVVFLGYLFELQNVIEEYKSCVVQHDPVLNDDDDEIEVSITDWCDQE